MTLPPEWQLAFTVAGVVWCAVAIGVLAFAVRAAIKWLRGFAEDINDV